MSSKINKMTSAEKFKKKLIALQKLNRKKGFFEHDTRSNTDLHSYINNGGTSNTPANNSTYYIAGSIVPQFPNKRKRKNFRRSLAVEPAIKSIIHKNNNGNNLKTKYNNFKHNKGRKYKKFSNQQKSKQIILLQNENQNEHFSHPMKFCCHCACGNSATTSGLIPNDNSNNNEGVHFTNNPNLNFENKTFSYSINNGICENSFGSTSMKEMHSIVRYRNEYIIKIIPSFIPY